MLERELEHRLIHLARQLIDQPKARIVVEAYSSGPGYWFGGGNLTVGPDDAFYLVGRYRNQGDSRTGLAAGTRGLELAIFRSVDEGRSFEKIASFNKSDLNPSDDRQVLSIEGSDLRFDQHGTELLVSTEKSGIGYPAELESFLKPGTGVWTIDRIRATTIDGLKSATTETVLQSDEPSTVHVKDPFTYQCREDRYRFFCTHPFNWTCSNTGYQRADDAAVLDFFPRGNVWDVAMARGTCVIDVPRVGVFANRDVQLMFYDGGECVRDLEPHAKAVSRPRGYSCEELGGLAYFLDHRWREPQRLSRYEPLFVSPFGTGCSRYVDVLAHKGNLYATWQQSQADGSQPLVLHHLTADEIAAILR